ncbi:MAG: class I SAM-dependent methyltransferase [Betaproteobacteria bacterium]|nr:class I SAM-dependent methyltransferase [Betaproteobacteria bacterium]
MLLRFLGSLVRPGGSSDSPARARPRVLDAGGHSTANPIPAHFRDWERVVLGVESHAGPGLACDARDLVSLPSAQFDAVYCFHQLEQYHRLDGVNVLRGFMHLLKPGGFAQMVVTDLHAVMQAIAGANVDLQTVLYQSPAGPIAIEDLIYGSDGQPESPGAARHAHRSEFTPRSLCEALTRAGFAEIHAQVVQENFEITAFAFKSASTKAQRSVLNLPAA